MEPVIHVQRVKDKNAKGVFVERDANVFTVSAARRLEWLTALAAVTSYLELREHTGRDD